MKYYSKYPIFYTVMIVLCLAFVGGTAYNAYLYFMPRATSAKALKAKTNAYKTALQKAPPPEALKVAVANVEALKKQLDVLKNDLARPSLKIFEENPAPATGFALKDNLANLVKSWRTTAKKLNIVIPENVNFGYEVYLKPNADPAKEEYVEPIWRQALVLDIIMKKLLKSREEGLKEGKSPMYILSVAREMVEEQKEQKQTQRTGRRGRTNVNRVTDSSEIFTIPAAVTARKAGSLNTLAYRFKLAGRTDVLRNFLNELKDTNDAMLVVRSIDVALSQDSEIPSSEDAMLQQNEEEKPLINNALSTYTIVIEFVELAEDSKKKADNAAK